MNDISFDFVFIVCNNVFMKCNLYKLIKENHFTIEEVHKCTGLSRSTITQLAMNRVKRVDFNTIEKLCVFFNCKISDLFILEKEDV